MVYTVLFFLFTKYESHKYWKIEVFFSYDRYRYSCIRVLMYVLNRTQPYTSSNFVIFFFSLLSVLFCSIFFLLFLLPFDTLSLNWISDLYFNLADISFSRSISIWLVSCNATKSVCVYIFIVCKWLASRTSRHQLIVLLEFQIF